MGASRIDLTLVELAKKNALALGARHSLIVFLGVIDGVKTKGVEDETGVQWRKDLLRKFGYKL